MLDFICFSINNWEKRRARKQQFMLYLAKRDDVGKVLYIEPPLNFWRLILFFPKELKTSDDIQRWKRALKFKFEVQPDTSKLFVFTPIFFIPFGFKINFLYKLNMFLVQKIILTKAKVLGFDNFILWLYNPLDYFLLQAIKKRVLAVFDWAEDWPLYFRDYSLRVRSLLGFGQQSCIKGCDIVFTVSNHLLERAKKINSSVFRILDATAPEYFQESAIIIPKDIKDIAAPIIGYVGTISHRFDAGLVLELNRRIPAASIVLIGRILFFTKQIKELRCKKNVYFLGEREYSQIPSYIQHFDVCISPYLTEYTKSIPTKIYDYLACGKPVVSTFIRELEEFNDYIILVRDNEQFIKAVIDILNNEKLDLQEKCKKFIQENSWSNRVDDIMRIIKEKLKEKKSLK